MARAFVALGANLGRPDVQLRRALEMLAMLPDTWLVKASPFYASAPVGYAEQPDFVNAVAELDTVLTPQALIEALFAIEALLGRTRSFKNAPRVLDLDLLLYDQLRLDTSDLILPHPRMHERAFVLVPLADIDPDVMVPGFGQVAALLPTVRDQALHRLP
ncbi:2-amino-4-hydroxy-6-hydroxymethyldihydropteridine diphosphokinase [Chitiniphilus shinanonensis]|uniref:2-amino-4-hydroxy-6-hydroxymethyldihydropteridine pyrophosphokinase n=1 Tax=Chitiniphilus shinanonensis TaxID=553088 RepID=A0ABQ6C213_9NEIS|nr:2-amino-4-hydroxy-6-hydroxymethyldihydropteridine diphosphokinase [Chitiniphilus shinanonensis]GLS06183.1 2-amino-4-hydroxy-6-hydroxymethyldihydropteridine diphosphokinase [Chitiniphilus shinanonensis]